MFCYKCGAKLADKAKYCANCGVEIPVKKDETEESEKSSQNETLFSEKENSKLCPTEIILSEQEEPSSDKTEIIASEQYDQNSDETSNTNEIGILKPGEMFDGIYRVISLIGSGNFGCVYKAYHTRLKKEIVIKQIYRVEKNVSNSTEAQVLKNIKHSYLPQVYDFVERNGTSFTIMDFIPGSDIQKLVSGGRKFRGKEIIKIATQLCEAVNYLHNCNPPIIHSDIKPENIMLTDNGDICLIDMNVSLIFENDASVIGGTIGYAPPEQFGISLEDIEKGITGDPQTRKVKPYVNERSDIYSIGAFLRYLVMRTPPSSAYVGDNIPADTNIPDGLRQIIKKATMLEPSKRYKNASEMLVAVKNINKLDRRYRAIKIRRSIVTIIAVILMAGSVVLNREGVRKLAEEHEEKYQNYITEIVNNIDSGDYNEAKEIILTASEFEPSRIEPYYNYEKILYAEKDYENCMNYPESVINAEIKQNELNDLGLLAEMYMMSADSAFELENYENAIVLYNKTLDYSDKLVECYRDLTISYARLGNIEQAEGSLEKAEQLGISDDRLELMQGEIHAAKGEINEAYNCFEKTLELTNDDYIRFRALLVCDKTMLSDTENAAENAQKMITLLKGQESKVSLEYAGVVKEMLANEYAIAEDFENAAICYQSLLNDGLLNYTLQKNYFNILYSKLQSYEQCLSLLGQMKEQNAEDYWVDMNMSYTYIAIENAKTDQLKRNYLNAYTSYKTAVKEYETYTQNGKSDANMDRLKGLINDLISYGWIKEE